MSLVKHLDHGNNMNGIDSAGTRVGEDGDENVFLDIEGPRVEGELEVGASEEDSVGDFGGHEVAKRDDGDLGGDGGDGERFSAIPEELIQK